MANTSGIRAGRAFVELGVSDRLTAGLRRAQRRLDAPVVGVQWLERAARVDANAMGCRKLGGQTEVHDDALVCEELIVSLKEYKS